VTSNGKRLPFASRVRRTASLVSGGWHPDKIVRVWDAESGKELRQYEGHTGHVSGVAFFPDGKRIASASADGTARIWREPR
jgi:WD40 repeat protein